MKKLFFILVVFTLFAPTISAQTDSLVFYNGNYAIGEVKSMNRGVLTFETDYSDSDFKIEWEKIKEIYTVTYFLITTSGGNRYNGHINTSEVGKILITTDDGQQVEVTHDDIVWLDDVDKGFWSQFYASIDVGFDMTKANNFSQLSSRITMGYLAERWNLDGTYNTLFSKQDEVDDINRTDGGVGYKYFLPKDWYPLISVDFLSNTEQKLKLRTTGKAGFGKFVIHTNRTYWGFSVGANINNETFSPNTVPDVNGNDSTYTEPDRQSWEGFFGTELNLFDIGDLNLSTKIFAYPSISKTEAGRWRTDFNFDAKYDMPFDDDFYIKLGITFNFDNQPVEGASETDYVLHTGFGWQW
ncbi:MAG: DUF481 domain-containing protein [Bacteroidales bacterium]|nr:DUF481 domain-containing protein [Bacteroidales bacterium]